MLPQIYIHFDEQWNTKRPLYVADNYSQDPGNVLTKFRIDLIQFLENKFKNFIIVNCPSSINTKFISIGFYKNKWFVSTTLQSFQMDNFASFILARPLPESKPFLLSSASNYHYSYTLENLVDPTFPMVYIKTAFNALAFFMGHLFVLQSVFDPIRNSIIKKENLNKFWIDSTMPTWLISWVKHYVPLKAHFVVLHGDGTTIDTYVSFYREPLNSYIRLTACYEGTPFKFGIVCDWKNHQEKMFFSESFKNKRN